jgi:5-methyltetrahydrofolate--homocysteine methyltransferase
MSDVLDKLKRAVTEGDGDAASAAAQQALQEGVQPLQVLNAGIVAGIEEAGRLWKANKYFLPDVIMAAEAFDAAIAVVEPRLKGAQGPQTGRFVIGTVAGDMHNLGKSIVIAMLRGAGFEVIDLGVDVPNKTILEKVLELKPDILGLGCYMSTTMLEMRDVIQALKAQGLRDKVKVMVGGVPVSQAFADEVGADAWGADALDAVAKARQLVGKEA